MNSVPFKKLNNIDFPINSSGMAVNGDFLYITSNKTLYKYDSHEDSLVQSYDLP
jgi:hypothetical protein